MPRTGPEFALAIVLAMLGVVVLIGLALLMAGVFMLGGFWIADRVFLLRPWPPVHGAATGRSPDRGPRTAAAIPTRAAASTAPGACRR